MDKETALKMIRDELFYRSFFKQTTGRDWEKDLTTENKDRSKETDKRKK